MLNLIRKDAVIQKKQLLTFIPIVILLSFFGVHTSPILIFFIVSLFVPMNGYMYDEKVESNIFLNSLPYTRKEIVNAKYIGSIVYMVLSIGFTSVILYLSGLDFTFNDIAIATGLFFISASLLFPLFYILKPSYVGVLMLIALFVASVIIPRIIHYFTEHLTAIMNFLTSQSTVTLYLSGTAIAIGLYLISWLVSQFIYQRKVF